MTAKKDPINIILAQATDKDARHQAGTILPFDDGRLLLSYSHFYDYSAKDDGPAHIVARWSHDEGDTWGEPFEVQENIGRLNCMTPSLLRLPSGRILLEFMRKDGQRILGPTGESIGNAGRLHPMLKTSDDEGQSWSEPRQITDGEYWATCHDRLFLTSHGRVLLPVYTPIGAFCWLSDDGGDTWRQGKGALPPHPDAPGYAEPMIVETKDNKLKMWVRNRGMRFHVAISEDDGDTWSLHNEWGPNARNAPCMVRRIPDTGDLLIIWNNNQIRTPLNCAISTDDGETWQHIKELESMTEWPKRCIHSYPSLAFLNGNAHITYYESAGRWGGRIKPDDTEHLGAMLSLKYRRIPVEWFYE